MNNLSESEKVRLITAICSGKVNYADYLAGKYKWCNRCQNYEYVGSLTLCVLEDAVKVAENSIGWYSIDSERSMADVNFNVINSLYNQSETKDAK